MIYLKRLIFFFYNQLWELVFLEVIRESFKELYRTYAKASFDVRTFYAVNINIWLIEVDTMSTFISIKVHQYLSLGVVENRQSLVYFVHFVEIFTQGNARHVNVAVQ